VKHAYVEFDTSWRFDVVSSFHITHFSSFIRDSMHALFALVYKDTYKLSSLLLVCYLLLCFKIESDVESVLDLSARSSCMFRLLVTCPQGQKSEVSNVKHQTPKRGWDSLRRHLSNLQGCSKQVCQLGCKLMFTEFSCFGYAKWSHRRSAHA
jgi:hypothetical protein